MQSFKLILLGTKFACSGMVGFKKSVYRLVYSEKCT